jgi:hypothetical protein
MDACNTCYDACINEEDVKKMADYIRLDRECADICGLAARTIQSESPFVGNKSAVYVHTYVMHVEKNSVRMIMITIRNVRMHAFVVQKHAEKCSLINICHLKRVIEMTRF